MSSDTLHRFSALSEVVKCDFFPFLCVHEDLQQERLAGQSICLCGLTKKFQTSVLVLLLSRKVVLEKCLQIKRLRGLFLYSILLFPNN